ncbi:MAG: PKD domain-containing protein, partial [Candidatus Thermoplasmatota archaeon]|nr:PKD domain-containing protein [Candidatus Thermoplasmatota archaeon]
NAGLSIANYCGHGSPTSWGNGGGFSNSNVNSLVNDNMLPFIVSVACNNGQFDDYEPCFAEAWLRATNNGEPTGAIGMYASTISQSWDPPMDAEDEFNDLLVRTYADNYKTTYGALCYNGAMHMNDEYGSAGYTETDYWTVFGDPSLQVRTDTPSTMNVQHDPLVQIGATTYDVDIPGVKDALCAVSSEGVLYGYGFSDTSGHAVVTFFEPMEFMPEVNFVVTAFNKIPYMTTLQVGSSYPPDIPSLDGPNAGCRNKEYTFTAQSTDPEGDEIFYLFDWGDGYQSDWIGPIDSGDPVSASHAWESNGVYNVTVRAKDDEGAMSRWCDPHAMVIDVPMLDIAPINGKLIKISSAIRNQGVAEADDVNWVMALDGGVILFGKEHSGTITTIPAGGSVEVQSGLIFGFGQTRVILTAETSESTDTRTQGATVLFFFVNILPGGG